MLYSNVLAWHAISKKEMLIEHKSYCYSEMKPRKRQLCAPYNQLYPMRKKRNSILKLDFKMKNYFLLTLLLISSFNINAQEKINETKNGVSLYDAEKNITKVEIKLYENQNVKGELGFSVFIEGWHKNDNIEIFAIGPNEEEVNLIKRQEKLKVSKEGKLEMNIPYQHINLYPGEWILFIEGKSGKHGHIFNVPEKNEVILSIKDNVKNNNDVLGFRVFLENWGANSEFEIHIIDPNGKIASITSDKLKSDKDGKFNGFIPYSYGELESGTNILVIAGKIGLHKIRFEIPKKRIVISENEKKRKEFCREATQKGKDASKHFKNSYFTYDRNNTFIQVMYLSEISADSGQSYSTMSRESKEPNYIDTLGKLIFNSYKNADYEFIDRLGSLDFTKFQVILVYNDNTKAYSKKMKIN
jgi:hypothetical protein